MSLRRLIFGDRNRIGRRLAVWVIAFSSLITLCISTVQLSLEYRDLHRNAESDLEGVEIYVPSIAQSLWNFDDKQLQLALDALVGLSGIHAATIRTPEQDRQWTAGDKLASSTLTRTYTLYHRSGGRQTVIGTLEVAASLNAIYRQVAEHAVEIIVGNGVKTFLVAIFMMLLFRRLITRRLQSMAGEVRELLPAALPEVGRVTPQAMPTELDELDEVAWAIDTTRSDLRQAVADVRDLNARLLQRERELRRHLDTLAMLEEVVLELDAAGHILHASPGWTNLCGQEDSPPEMSLMALLPKAEDRRALADALEQIHQGARPSAFLRLHFASGTRNERWVDCRLSPEYADNGELAGVRGVLHDVTSTHEYERRIAHMALHDALTSLPNRTLLEDRLRMALGMADRGQHKVAVCFIDLDHFKNVNDSLGHRAGDQLLVAIAERLRAQLREGDTLARWGGDEFVLLLSEIASEDEALELVHNMEEFMHLPVRLEGSEQRVTSSMGIALYPDDAPDAETLLAHAESAMFYAKAQGRNQTSLFAESREQDSRALEIKIQGKLAGGLADRRIQAWFQPILSAKERDCRLLEVLARWHDEELGWVGPATFIPIAEKAGMIGELGRQVWLDALPVLAAWRSQGMGLRLAVNLSKRQLFSRVFIEQMHAELARHGLTPQDIELEITESVALLDVAHASERLQELNRMGFHLALDDFGTGYSSLSQLHEMPVGTVKIDISFVRRIHEPAGEAMAVAIIQLSKALGMKTIAEGVEDAQTAEKLEALGVDYLQGFFFARPMPAHELDAWLKQRPH